MHHKLFLYFYQDSVPSVIQDNRPLLKSEIDISLNTNLKLQNIVSKKTVNQSNYNQAWSVNVPKSLGCFLEKRN